MSQLLAAKRETLVRVDYLIKFLKELGYSYRELGKFCGVADSTIRNWGLDKRLAPSRVLEELFEALYRHRIDFPEEWDN